jgi:hypothetical protein
MRKHAGLIYVGALCALFAFAPGCDSDEGNGGTGATGGTGGSGGTGGNGGPLCVTPGSTVTLPSEISSDTTLTSDCTYRLSDKVYVRSGTLTIEASTKIIGDPEAALIITRDAMIDAEGTETEPIVFTSSAPEGARQPKDWGGVVLAGNAVLSFGDNQCGGDTGVVCEGSIEGIADDEEPIRFGGTDDDHNCGTLKYVRIEFAGFPLTEGNELNSLGVGGCGSDTTLDYIQLHLGEDDGVEFFGGTASISHLVVSNAGDDGLDWDQGWRGSATNFIIDHQLPRSSTANGIEADNSGDRPDAEPRSNPTIANGTLIGAPNTLFGMHLRRGTIGSLSGLIVTGFANAGIDVEGTAWDGAWPTTFLVRDTCFWSNNPDYAVDENDPEKVPSDPALFFDEPTELADGLGNTTDQDPMLVDPANNDYAAGNENCAGAFAPDGVDWTVNWTEYPEN